MKVKCPYCGNVGTDRAPYPESMRGPEWKESREERLYDHTFEIRGNSGSHAVKKCLKCGKGVAVHLFPPRFRKISEREWVYLQEQWELWEAGRADRDEAREARRRQVQIELGHDPDTGQKL